MDSPKRLFTKSLLAARIYLAGFGAHHENIDHDFKIARPVCNDFNGCSKFDFYLYFQCTQC
jgi:hypothetical protein